MIKFTGENSFFLPNYSRNQINAENKIPELVSNDFSIEVDAKIDWKKCVKKMDYKNHFVLKEKILVLKIMTKQMNQLNLR